MALSLSSDLQEEFMAERLWLQPCRCLDFKNQLGLFNTSVSSYGDGGPHSLDPDCLCETFNCLWNATETGLLLF